MKKNTIPIAYCFDNNYVIPAAVAFYSLLENSSDKYFYDMYIMHSDISLENQEKLISTIDQFPNASLNFIDMNHRFDELWEKISTKGHFSKEVMYKTLVASIFPEHDKIVVSDVDVVFLGDISDSYTEFDVSEDYYLAGVKMVGKITPYMNLYKKEFTEEEIEKLSGFCGGYIIFNLKKLREDKMEEKFIECFINDGYRINQMEQDVLNLCCFPKTKDLPLKYLTCSYVWDLYKDESDFINDVNFSELELKEAMKNPVQLHYATSTKPWKNVDSTKSEEWFKYIVKTPFLSEYLKNLPEKIILKEKNYNNQLEVSNLKKIMTSSIKFFKKIVDKTSKLSKKTFSKIFKLPRKVLSKIFRLSKKVLSKIFRLLSKKKNFKWSHVNN